MAIFSDLLLLADVAEIVRIRPALLGSPLEVEIHRLTARNGMKIKGKRSLRTRRNFKKSIENGPLEISLPSRVGKKRKRKTGPKKQSTAPRSATIKELPLKARSRIQGMCGADLKLILEKELTHSDLNTSLGRVSFPPTKVLADFLEQEEHRRLENEGTIEVSVIEPCLGLLNLTLKKWNMSTRPVYVLTTGWNALAHNPKNGLEEDDLIQIWSFRAEGRLGLAIVKADVGAARESIPSSPTSVLSHHEE